MKCRFLVVIAAFTAGCTAGGENIIPVPTQANAAQPASAPAASELVLPLEVDIAVAEQFVRIGYALDRTQRFQSTEFLTPRLRTAQASHLIQLVKNYNEFNGESVAQAVSALRGRVSGVEFGREGSPVLYLDLPYWTHQREESKPAGMGAKISDEENDKLVAELRDTFDR